ncbi:MAG: InlB B-repeat-containing protein [Lachnospiraceae bacterium]
MKRILAIILTLMMAASILTGCRHTGGDAETTSAAAAETTVSASSEDAVTESASAETSETETAATEALTTEAVPTEALTTEAASSQEDKTFLTRINTEGSGYVAYTDDGSAPKLNKKNPSQSCAVNSDEGTKIRAEAYPDKGYQFVKWTKNRKDFSKKKQISFSVTEDAAYTAVFSKKNKKEDASIKSFKTLGDLFAAVASRGTAFDKDLYVYAFELKGVYYRALTRMPSDVSKKIWSLNYDDDDYESKVEAILSPLKIREIQNLSDEIPSKEDLEALKGRTGRQLIKDGWTFRGYDLKTMKFKAWHGVFAYTVTFDGKLNSIDELGEYEEVYPLKVKKVSYEGFGDITNLD